MIKRLERDPAGPHLRCDRVKTLLIGLCTFILVWFCAAPAWAFCGFFVAKVEASLHNASSKVIIARDGDRSTFVMANDYQGKVKDFARIVPIPVIPKREQIRIGSNELVEGLDAFTAPRLVQYYDDAGKLWQRERNAYLLGGFWIVAGGLYLWFLSRLGGMKMVVELCVVLLIVGILAAVSLPSLLGQANKAKQAADNQSAINVTVADRFTLGEYDITLLSAEESDSLAAWLSENGYPISANARSMLQDYIEQGMKFFVVKVNLEAFTQGEYNYLRPIVLEYDSPNFMLPMRLGTLNATAEQDLIVFILSRDRAATVANYKTAFIPTDNKSRSQKPSGEELPPFVQEEFPAFYEAMFQREYEKQGKNAAFLEYAGFLGMGACDPCSVPPEEIEKLQTLLDQDGFTDFSYITRLHVRYTLDKFPEDLVFAETSRKDLYAEMEKQDLASRNRGVLFQGRYVIRRLQDAPSGLAKWRYGRWKPLWAKNLADSTGWDLKSIEDKIALYADTAALALRWSEQGQKLARSGQHERALNYYKKALELDPSNATIWSNRGVSLYELKRPQEALEAFEKALSLNSIDWTARDYQEKLRVELGGKLR
ncbi:DUF2330 domain-containing protein [Lusitaniella coriacea LEGE 07157]|uniref:DUF2330 domain-containing protein n=1 Tax=Lusitaniella coriacea LEGE 07157 TaxID=945747 RepID=A0A8J7DW50_9CYAN|nr:DUF2330 domain-containing protein [Lusitaniella coriacea]MBE9116123.1 DUF2330 domain-containing protein [Lusitaniella coriacea LEGE 07157]